MKRKMDGIKSFGFITVIAIVFLQCSFAMRENEIDSHMKFDLVADEVKEKTQKGK